MGMSEGSDVGAGMGTAKHAEAPGSEYWPDGQLSHTDAPDETLKSPALQGAQSLPLLDPVDEHAVPAAHEVHAELPVPSA